MPDNLKISLLRAIGNIYETSANSNLEKSIWRTLKDSLATVSSYFGVNTMQAFFLAHLFALKHSNTQSSLSRITDHIGCNSMLLLEYTEELYALINKGIICRQESRRRENRGLATDELYIISEIEEAILRGLPMPATKIEPKSPKADDFVDFLDRIRTLHRNYSDDKITGFEFDDAFEDLMKNNLHFHIVNEMDKNQMKAADSLIFFMLVWNTLHGNDSTAISEMVRIIMRNNSVERINYLQSFLKEQNKLQKLGWVVLSENRFLNDAEIELDDKAITSLNASGLHLERISKSRKDLIAPNTIRSKALFFNPREEADLSLLQSMLMDRKYKQLRSRLRKKKLPEGLTVLFFGYPGTGKTESVLQMARKSGREILKVDISNTKSKWFGESEKIIKRVFTTYREIAAVSKRTPILLINEADAILSKRKDTVQSGSDQTENAIQNILLEELENFNGILMATTNLVRNLDDAFDRRFLLKIEFGKPQPEVKAKIWKSKMPELSQSQCLQLASDFDLTGGQIDNIVRKSESVFVVHGTPASFQEIRDFCNTESWHQKKLTGIGFKRGNKEHDKAA